MLYRVERLWGKREAVWGFEVQNGRVIRAAPMGRQYVGEHVEEALRLLHQAGYQVEALVQWSEEEADDC